VGNLATQRGLEAVPAHAGAQVVTAGDTHVLPLLDQEIGAHSLADLAATPTSMSIGRSLRFQVSTTGMPERRRRSRALCGCTRP
jgi:hypothetical protein